MIVEYEKRGRTAVITLNRPEARNAVSGELAQALEEAIDKLEADDDVWVGILAGNGPVFCAGADLKAVASGKANLGTSRGGFGGFVTLERTKPVIAAVSGAAVAGGMELALWADIRVMEDTAFMGVYCRRWGIPLIDGGTVRLPRLIGEGRAMDLILTGRKVKAKEAMDIGLCEYLVRDGQALIKAEKLAKDIARFPQSCMRADRRSVRSQHHLKRWEAMNEEWKGSKSEVSKGIKGALAFVSGKGRGGDFSNL